MTTALTLTLSPEEREQLSRLGSWAEVGWAGAASQHFRGRRMILPLPGREGRGEGERSITILWEGFSAS
jgi:hypothetical protein